MRRLLSLALVLSVAAAVMIAAAAQTNTGRIHGVVRDAGGAAVPGVEVRLARGAQIIQRIVTDANGEFDFPIVAPGSYTVTAVLTGFETTTLTAEVQARSTRELTVTLRIGELQERAAIGAKTLSAPPPPRPPRESSR